MLAPEPRQVRLRTRLVSAAFLIAAGAAQAGLFRCTRSDGKIVYGDQPCAQGQTEGGVKGIPASSTGAAGGGSHTKPDATTCRKLRDALNADRARLGRMTDKEKNGVCRPTKRGVRCLPLMP